jgi:hypothetical protein
MLDLAVIPAYCEWPLHLTREGSASLSAAAEPSGSFVRRTASITCGALLLIPFGWFVASRVVPIPLRLIVSGLWLLAAVRPRAALVTLALLAPFGSVLLTLSGSAPVPYTESLVLATLSGMLIAAAWAGDRRVQASTPSLAWPAAMFVAVVIASLGVALGVSQAGLDSRRLFVESFGTFFAREYLLGGAGEWPSIAAAFPLIEGVLLLLLTARWTRRSPDGSRTLITALTVAAGAAAIANITALAQALAGVGSLQTLLARLLTSRISVHVTDANAAGSYFAMAGFLAVALYEQARRERARSRVWAAIAVVVFVALWLTGSRTAVACSIVLVAAALIAERDRWRVRPLWAFGAGALLALMAGAFVVGLDPRAVAGRDLQHTFESRGAFLVTGLRMMASAPLFGVGIGRYMEMSGRFMPESIYWFFFHENAHNNFLQIGGELGIAGLSAFVWLICAAALRLRRGLASSGDRVLAGAAVGLAAFVATWLTSHPLLVPEVAAPFWLLAGAAIGRADAARPAASRSRATEALLVVVASVALAASVAPRAHRQIAALNFADQSYGFYDWEGASPPLRTRWTAPSAAFFVPPAATEVDIPLHTLFSDRRSAPPVVSVAIGGRVFHRLELTSDAWTTVRLKLPPPTGPEWRRIDIVTTPPWSPADLLGARDSRVLGVQVRDVSAR